MISNADRFRLSTRQNAPSEFQLKVLTDGATCCPWAVLTTFRVLDSTSVGIKRAPQQDVLGFLGWSCAFEEELVGHEDDGVQ